MNTKGIDKESLKNERINKVAEAFSAIIDAVGEDPNRKDLIETPIRAAKAFLSLTEGYEDTLEGVVKEAIYDEESEDLVIVKDIEFFSRCEHHLMPFYGSVSVGYLPNKQNIGLSKIARIVDMYSKRFQSQERMTSQIAQAVDTILNPKGVAVFVEASHMCMVTRGVQKLNSVTITTSMIGEFKNDHRMRDKFINLVTSNKRG